ncbi:gamma carbonic anhydrase family protein [Burkholderia cepacia]|uniref:gamma carbonic anhydrase family protein n=1 Tax=Burkholderia cepacia TaxID=292 RepID=UPI002AB750C4|nr:gamma carbonic anhydrase family protein [Burkholderia cepacia]
MTLYNFEGEQPQLAESAWVAPQAVVIGRATLAERASVWFNAVIRADNEPVDIGAGSNVQDGAVLHTDPGFPMHIAANVTIGHQAMLHGCTVGEGSLIGVQAVVLNGAVIGRHCLVGAGAVVTEGKVFPERSLILGAPAKAVRELSDEQVANLLENAADYVRRADVYRHRLDQVG